MTQFARLPTLSLHSVRLRDVGLEEVILQRVERRRVGGEEERGAVGANLRLVLAHDLGQDEREERCHQRGAVLGKRPADGQPASQNGTFVPRKIHKDSYYQSRRLRYGFQGEGESSCLRPIGSKMARALRL